MESHPKKLTVSYGTFSCTLEGFDDPFTTMKLVAEYFRRLAAEDRYFGSEPLQPDASILHKIARDANPFKVDAEVHENGVTLRKARVVDETPEEEPAAPAAAEAPEALASAREETVVALPVFRSLRAVRAAAAEVEEAGGDDDLEEEESTLVEPARFVSRREILEAGTDEPDKPASEIMAEEEEEEPAAELEEPAAAEGDATAGPSHETEDEISAAIARRVARVSLGLVETGASDADIQREEAALERLLETTNAKLSAADASRRSTALERLKAAVAATEAERRLRAGRPAPRPGRAPAEQAKVDPAEFRQKIADVRKDHEQVAAFTRPTAKGTTKRPRGTIATLILGAEQRVKDDSGEAAGAPGKKPAADTRARDGFDAFAERMGADSLEEMLEAAAAWLTLHEKMPVFSRSALDQTLEKFLAENGIGDDSATRAFEGLLRDGRVLRVKADAFMLSRSLRMRYEERLAS